MGKKEDEDWRSKCNATKECETEEKNGKVVYSIEGKWSYNEETDTYSDYRDAAHSDELRERKQSLTDKLYKLRVNLKLVDSIFQKNLIFQK